MKKGKIWLIIAMLFIGYSGGIITGVVVDTDQVYHTTIKKIRQNKSPDGTLVIDFDATTGEQKSKNEMRQEKKEAKISKRNEKKAARNLKRLEKQL